jgi:hypothetical protein
MTVCDTSFTRPSTAKLAKEPAAEPPSPRILLRAQPPAIAAGIKPRNNAHPPRLRLRWLQPFSELLLKRLLLLQRISSEKPALVETFVAPLEGDRRA